MILRWTRYCFRIDAKIRWYGWSKQVAIEWMNDVRERPPHIEDRNGIAVGNMTLAFTIPDLIALILDPSVKSCRMRMAWNHVEEWVMNQMNCIDGNWWFKKRDLSLEQTDMKERRRMIVRKWQEEIIETWKDLQTTIWSKEETVDETIESSEGMEEWRNSEDEISYGTCLTARSHPSDVKEH